MPEDINTKPAFNPEVLSEKDRKDFDFVKKRILELQEARRQEHYGVNIEKIWSDADREYIPHRLRISGRKMLAQDETLGWRGTSVVVGIDDWRADYAKPNPYIKIQTALSILIDQNPKGVLTATSKKYQATSSLMRQLYQRSWEFAKSKQQLKLFVFNLAKYGFATARTYPLRLSREVEELVEYDSENPKNSKYEKKEVVEFNDIFRENLDPWNVWIDDMARPNNSFSLRDWCWRKVYPYDVALEEFGKYTNWKNVKPGGITTEKISSKAGPDKKFKDKNLVEIYFYENRLKDLFVVVANEVPILIEPLPISDATGNKKLSLWQGYWNLRHAESPYGIGLYEAIRHDNNLLDRVRNQTIDQLVLSINKMFFYQGTTALSETGDIVIKPGVGKQVLNPKDINWLQVPGPGAEAWKGIEGFQKDVDDASGISETLMGVVTGKTAFEIAQAKESALKRLKTPLDNILDALNQEGYITISLIQLLYSIPETYKITDKTLIEDYLKEIEGDPELYERDEDGNFVAKVYPEFPLNLDKDEKGNLIETSKTRFFRVKPRFLQWEGIININPQSILTPSKQIDKALELEMYNMVIPLLAQPPEVYGKAVKNIIKLYDKDPRDVLPDSWLQEPQSPQNAQGEPLIIPANQQGGQLQAGAPPQGTAKVVPSAQIPEKPQGLAQKIIGRLSRPFRKV